jgi:hypothetical protein
MDSREPREIIPKPQRNDARVLFGIEPAIVQKDPLVTNYRYRKCDEHGPLCCTGRPLSLTAREPQKVLFTDPNIFDPEYTIRDNDGITAIVGNAITET